MKRHVLLTSIGLLTLSGVLTLHAQGPNQASTNPSSTDKAGQIKEDLGLREQILARQFGEFEQSLLKLVQRMERSPKQEDRDRAVVLRKVLDRAKDSSISTQFEQIVDFLKKEKLSSVPEIKTAMDRSGKLAEDLREILNLFREDTRSTKLRDERTRLEELIKQLEKVIHDQKVVQGQTDLNKTDKTELKGAQERVTDATAKLLKKIDGKEGKGGEGKNAKGENKEGGKSKGNKAGEAKDAGKGGEKKGEAKEGKGGEGKQGEAKGGEKKPGQGEPKEGTAKESKKGEGKPGEAKPGDPKSGKGGEGKEGEAKEGKAGEGKPGEAKGGEKKTDNPPDDKEAIAKVKTKPKEEAKPGEAKSGEKKAGGGQPKEGQAKASKSGESKPGDPKSGGDPKQGEAKGGEQKSGQGQAKDGGQPKQGEQPPQGAQKDDKKDGPPQGPQDPKQNVANGKKQIQDAEYEMKKAEENIAKNNNKEASDDQGQALKNLEEARKKLEALLRQLREEELERLLANLQVRCERMLAMQLQVLHGTEQVFKAIAINEDKKASRQNQQDSLKLSDDEKEIVGEARKASEILEAEGTAVAFPEVFQQIRQDMEHVQRRLGIVDVGVVTQAIENDIVDTLKEMIEALKKAQKDMQDKKSQSKPGEPPPPEDQKLLEQIAELKMIRSMQIRVNNRTLVYGRQYQDTEGEQTRNPAIAREIRNLAERQERIFEVTRNIAKGENR